ncbi:MAG: hypothetical protein LBR22_02685 [Desulfovibrio sp.]|nr:hypothetical protein [Desulfovibrio sp.]
MFGAVCPRDGDDFGMHLSRARTEMMGFCLQAFMEHRDGRPCVMALDQAGRHKSLSIGRSISAPPL